MKQSDERKKFLRDALAAPGGVTAEAWAEANGVERNKVRMWARANVRRGVLAALEEPGEQSVYTSPALAGRIVSDDANAADADATDESATVERTGFDCGLFASGELVLHWENAESIALSHAETKQLLEYLQRGPKQRAEPLEQIPADLSPGMTA